VSDLPPVESYIRLEVIGEEMTFAIGLEDRPGDDLLEMERKLDGWAVASAQQSTHLGGTGGLREVANAFRSYAIVNCPDRYWFCEVWYNNSYGSFYQIIQRPARGVGLSR